MSHENDLSANPFAADYDKVERLDGCNLAHQETHRIGDGKTRDDSTSDDSDSESDDDVINTYQLCKPVKFFYDRDVAEGNSIVRKPLPAYLITLKDEYKPKDTSRQNVCEKFLGKVVGRFALEAVRYVNKCGNFEALLTDEEHQKLCGMEEVAKVINLQHYFCWD